jgi:hypothetical protein
MSTCIQNVSQHITYFKRSMPSIEVFGVPSVLLVKCEIMVSSDDTVRMDCKMSNRLTKQKTSAMCLTSSLDEAALSANPLLSACL